MNTLITSLISFIVSAIISFFLKESNEEKSRIIMLDYIKKESNIKNRRTIENAIKACNISKSRKGRMILRKTINNKTND